MRKFLVILLLVFVSCSKEKEPEVNIPDQRMRNFDRPTGTLRQAPMEGETAFDRFFNAFTDVSQPIMIPLPKFGKDKFDLQDELQEITNEYLQFIPKLADASFLLEKSDNGKTNYFFYQKVLMNERLKCPVIYAVSGDDMYFIMCTYDNEGGLVDAIVIAGSFNEMTLDAEIEKNMIIINDGAGEIRYSLNAAGKFNKK